MGIMEIILGYGSILFSGAAVGAIASYMAPEMIKRLKADMEHKKILDFYQGYRDNPEKFTADRPELAKFFVDKAWGECPCINCEWMNKKIKCQ